MTNIKICGLTNLEDAQVATRAGANLLGFIFYEPSPRYVAPETVREIVAAIRDLETAQPRFVGVFVNASLPAIEHIVTICGLDTVQLHGDEPPEFMAHFQHNGYKAVRPQSGIEAHTLATQYSLIPHAERLLLPTLLLEAYHPTLYGGTGHHTDWAMASEVARQYPVLLAGGLTPTSVTAAIHTVRPWGVDVSSGVEASKGKKDHALIRAFVAAVKHADLESESNSP